MLNFYHHTPLHHSSPVVAFNKPVFVYTLNVEKRPKVGRKGVFFEAIFKATNLKAHKTLRLVASLLGITLSHCQCGEGHRPASFLYHKTHVVTRPTNWNLHIAYHPFTRHHCSISSYL